MRRRDRDIRGQIKDGGVMCTNGCIDFGKNNLREEDVRGKAVIEVGSMNINGSLRPIVESFGAGKYIGVDIQPGPGVDKICKVEDLENEFGSGSFDLVICTELLEHVEDWDEAVHNLKQIVRPGGALLVTTRSRGFEYHTFPFDFWRYEISDMEFIFSDFDIKDLRSDPDAPGVLLFAGKPPVFTENDIKEYELYSILFGKRSPVMRDSVGRAMVFLAQLYKIVGKRISGSAFMQSLKNRSKREPKWRAGA